MPPASEDLEPLSPELVLVADEEFARRARERLPLPSFGAPSTAAAVEPPREVVPPPPAAVEPPPAAAASLPRVTREPPVPYPRVVLDDLPPPERRRPRRVLAIGLVALAALGGAGYVAATYLDDAVDAPVAGVRAAQTIPLGPGRESPTTATPGQPPNTTVGATTTTPTPHTSQPVTTTRAPVPSPTTTVAPTPTPPASSPTVRSATVSSRPATTRTSVASPTAPAPSAPAAPTGSFVPGRQWIWAAVPAARGYEFTIYNGGRVVFRARPAAARVQLPRSFRWQPGDYRWTVVTLPPGGGGPVVDSSFKLTAATAEAANRS